MADLSDLSDKEATDMNGSELAGESNPQPAQISEVVLSKPPEELAKRLLTKVGFNERLIGYRVDWSTGPMQVTLYSFKEVVVFLSSDKARISSALLAKWMREVYKDTKIADKMEDAIEQGKSDKEKLELVGNIMEQRLRQCREIIGEETGV